MIAKINTHSGYRFDLDNWEEDLPAEQWKPVPGFIGYYMISDYGRVKSLDRVIPHPRLGTQSIKGRILTQKILKNINVKTGEPSLYLQVSLGIKGKSTHYNVRRLVYAAFRCPRLKYSSSKKCVINIDGNGLNCTLDNLALVSLSQKSQRAFDRERVVESYLKTADRSLWSKPFGGSVRCKPITQKNLSGDIINSFNSISSAARFTGFGEKEIIYVAKGKWKQYNGYIWQYS